MSDFGFRALRAKTHQKLQLSGMWAVVGDESGNVFDPTISGNVYVRIQYANGYGHRISVRGPVNTSMFLTPGAPVELIYTSDKRLQIKGYEPNASVTAGVNLLAANVQQQESGSFVGQQSIVTALVTPQQAPDLTVVVKSWSVIFNGTYYEFGGSPTGGFNLSSYVPSSGNNRYVVLFIQSDFSTLTAFASTARSIADLELGPADIQECVSAAALTDTPLAAIRMYGNQTTIVNDDIKLDLRQFLNLQPLSNSGNVSGPGTSTDRAVATWNGTTGTALRNNANNTIDGSGNASDVSEKVTGTGGNGFVEAVAQSASPSAPSATGWRAFATSVGMLAWRVKNGADTYVRSFIGALTGDHTYTLPDADGTIPLSGGSSTDRAIVTWNGTIGAALRDNSSATIDASGNISVVAGTFSGRVTTQSGRNVKVRVVTAAGAVTVATTDDVVVVNKTSGAATTANLPSSPSTGDIYTIKDGKGDAATNNITVTPASGNIDGSATYVMNMNYQAVTVVYNGTQWNII